MMTAEQARKHEKELIENRNKVALSLCTIDRNSIAYKSGVKYLQEVMEAISLLHVIMNKEA